MKISEHDKQLSKLGVDKTENMRLQRLGTEPDNGLVACVTHLEGQQWMIQEMPRLGQDLTIDPPKSLKVNSFASYCKAVACLHHPATHHGPISFHGAPVRHQQ